MRSRCRMLTSSQGLLKARLRRGAASRAAMSAEPRTISPQRPRALDEEEKERQRKLQEAVKKMERAEQEITAAKEKAKVAEASARAEAMKKLEAANAAHSHLKEQERQEEEAQRLKEEAARKRFLPDIELTISSTHNQEDEKGQIFTVYIISVESPTKAFTPWHVGRRFIEFCQMDDVLRKTIPDLPPLPPKTTPLANKLDPGVVSTRIVELQRYLDFIAPLYKARLTPVFRKFLETNRKYADDNYEPPQVKGYYVDCIILECSGLLPREFEPRSYMDYIPGLGKSWNRATFVKGINGEQEYFSTPIPDELNPVWNEDCTWYYEEGDEGMLRLQVTDKGRNVDTLIGEMKIDLYSLKEGEVLDLYDDIKIGRNFGGGKLHVILFKTSDPAQGMLAYKGPPLHSIPLRVDAGDIFLMNSSYFLTHGTKLATMSQWDHVAMAVRLPGKQRLRFFESTMDGVEADYTLESSVAAYLWCSKIAVRRLVATRTPEMMTALSAFVKEVNGRPYKSSPLQLVRAWAQANETEDMSSLFCSQLIAAAYRSMGLIKSDVIADNFLPSDFAGDLKGSLVTGKLSAMVVFPMKKREYQFTSTVDVPVGTPSTANLTPQPKVVAPEELQQPSLQELRERRRKEKRTRRDKEKAKAAEQTPGADASPAVARASVDTGSATSSATDVPAAAAATATTEEGRHHKSHREKKEKHRHRKQREEQPADVAPPDPSAALLAVLEARVAAIDKELRAAGTRESVAKLTDQLNEAKTSLTSTAFPAGDIAFRAELLSDRIEILLSRHEQPPLVSAPILIPSKAASDRQASTGASPIRSPKSWSQARGETTSASAPPLAPFGSHRSSFSGVTPAPVTPQTSPLP